MAILAVTLLTIIPLVTANPHFKKPLYTNTSSPTSTGLGPLTASPCCFVVQDTVTEYWWEKWATRSAFGLANLTSITTLITPYPTTTFTNIETNTYFTNASYTYLVPTGGNPLALKSQAAPGPAETTGILGFGQSGGQFFQDKTQVVTAGVTVASPSAFNVYSTVKIITVPAVTDSLGQLCCATVSTQTLSDVGNSTNTLNIFNGINSYAEGYYAGSARKTSQTPTGVVISLTTPYIDVPSRGNNGANEEEVAAGWCDPSGPSEAFGYVPQTLIDFLAANPYYVSQYPDIGSCLPGGPPIVQWSNCSAVLAVEVNAGGNLTQSTVITVTPTEEPISATTIKDPARLTPPQTIAITTPTTSSIVLIISSVLPVAVSADTSPLVPLPSTSSVVIVSGPPLNFETTSTSASALQELNSSPLASSHTTTFTVTSLELSVVTPFQNSISQASPQGTTPNKSFKSLDNTTPRNSFPATSSQGTMPGPTTTPLTSDLGISGEPTSISGINNVIISEATAIGTPQESNTVSSQGQASSGTVFEIVTLSISSLTISGPTTFPTTFVNSVEGAKTTIISNVIFGSTTTIQVSQEIPTSTLLPPTSTSKASSVAPFLVSSVSKLTITGATTIPINSAYTIPGTEVFTVISGVSNVILTEPTTVSIPISISSNPGTTIALPTSGESTVISGTTNIIATSDETIPLPKSAKTEVSSGITDIIVTGVTTLTIPLSGKITIISGTTNAIVSEVTIIPLPVSGMTTVISGTTNVIVPGGTGTGVLSTLFLHSLGGIVSSEGGITSASSTSSVAQSLGSSSSSSPAGSSTESAVSEPSSTSTSNAVGKAVSWWVVIVYFAISVLL